MGSVSSGAPTTTEAPVADKKADKPGKGAPAPPPPPPAEEEEEMDMGGLFDWYKVHQINYYLIYWRLFGYDCMLSALDSWPAKSEGEYCYRISRFIEKYLIFTDIRVN